MGFGSSLKKTIRKTSGGKVLGKIGGTFGGTSGGALLSSISGASQAERAKAAANAGISLEDFDNQITTANIFSKLSNEQKKDLLLNNPNIQTSTGSQSFNPLTNTITLGESQFTEDQRLRQEGLAAELAGSLTGGLPSTDPSARFEEGRQLFQPEFTEQRDQLEQRLVDQGFSRGSEAFDRELNRLGQSQGRQLQELAFNSQASSEASRAARFNEISSLLGQQQVGGVGFQQFQPQFSGLDLFGAEQSGLNRQFQAQQASAQRSADSRNALIGAIGDLGSGIGAAFSDKNLKENIKLIGNSPSGIPIYEFDYINKSYGQFRYEGVMAQDLLELKPEAVINNDKHLKVNYDLIDVDFRRIN